jgi:capsular polysaccharide biosynthesis protein
MMIGLQKIRQMDTVERVIAGVSLSIGTAMLKAVLDDIEKNRGKIKALVLLSLSLFLISTMHSLKKMKDTGQLRVLYENAKAKVEANEAKNRVKKKLLLKKNHRKTLSKFLLEQSKNNIKNLNTQRGFFLH